MTGGGSSQTTWRGRQWLGLVLLMACLVFLHSAAAHADPPGPGFVRALILYDAASDYGWVEELHAVQVANLLGHFPLEWEIAPVEDYVAGEVEDYSVVFYVGGVFDNPLPAAFLSDAKTTERTVCWFGYNLWQIAWDEQGFWDQAFTDRYGFQFAGIDDTGFPEIQYKGQCLLKDLSDPDLGATFILDPDRAEVKAVAHRPPTETEPEASWPYVVHSGNLWYFADIPFSYASEEDRYLVFCDLIHDIVGIDHAPNHRGLIRIEDIRPTEDPTDLDAISDYLSSRGVPFLFSIIPVYRDSLGVLNGGVPQETRLSNEPAVASALLRMGTRGGQPILHGYTHQYDTTPNPYNGRSGDDSEFFLSAWDEVLGETLLLSPVPEDSVAWVNDRIDRGLAELSAAGITPIAWETPHYVASALDYVEFGNRFSLTSGRVLYSSSLGPNFAGQFFPYVIERDIYGQKIMPENLGNVELEPFYDYPAHFPVDIVRAAQKNLVVRDSWAAAYFHPGLDLSYLAQIIDGVTALGYTYSAAPTVIAETGPYKTIFLGQSAVLDGSASNGSPPYSYLWFPTTGLDDPTKAQPTASPTETTVYTLTVTDDTGQTDTDMVTVTVTVASEVVAEAGPDKVIASGGADTLEGSASGGAAPYSYSWTPTIGLDDPTQAQPTASPTETTVYTLTVTDDIGQMDTAAVPVTVASEVVAEAGPDKVIASGGEATLEGSASGGAAPYSYSWTPTIGLDDPTQAQPTASPTETTVYTLTVTDEIGQTDTGTVTVDPLDDVPPEYWACHEILACVNAEIVSGYEDGLYHPDWSVDRAQMAVFISRSICSPMGEDGLADYIPPDTSSFTDIATDFWAYKHIEYAIANNIVRGYEDGTYHPEYNVTRDQMAVYVARAMVAASGEAGLADYLPAAPRNFPDVPEDFWAYTHIEYCVENDVVQGYDDGYYHPELVVTRDQMAVCVARAFGLAS